MPPDPMYISSWNSRMYGDMIKSSVFAVDLWDKSEN